MSYKNVIELQAISKQYPGKEKKANNNITLNIRSGEVLCVAGENGAGKTTLMKILCGLETPDCGDIFINGKKETINSPLTAKKLGIGMVHQHFMLFPEYTVAENIVMGDEPLKWGIIFDTKKANNTADKIIDGHNFSIKSSQKVKDLTLGQMQQVEICRILNHNARIIILDEPTSILTEQETQSLFKTIRQLASQGKSVVFITHKLNEIKSICDRVAVLRKGELAGILEADEIDEKKIAALMFKDFLSADNTQGNRSVPFENPEINKKKVITFNNVTVRRKGQKHPLLDNVSFSVHSGEILGFTGVGGNGLGVIEAVLGGFLHPAQGQVLHEEKNISDLNIRELRKQGFAYVPADRLKVASAREASIEENMIINRRHEFVKGIFLNKKASAEFTGEMLRTYNIAVSGLNEKCGNLSGGNLQKLILAREINCLKDYIVFSEPTWGLDIASSRFVMDEIENLRKKGAAVILISTNLDEVLALSDRIIVMYKGKTKGIFTNTKDMLVREKINNSMIGLGINE